MNTLSWDTPTMAELYVRQGHLQPAVEIYRKLVQEPEGAQFQPRLSELEGQLQNQGAIMSFREHIQQVVDGVPGTMACAVMGFDGIAIDSVEVPGGNLDIPTLLTEYSAAAAHLRGAGQQQDSGSLRELVVSSDKLTIIIQLLTNEYFFASVLTPQASSGKSRYMMRIRAPKILKELS